MITYFAQKTRLDTCEDSLTSTVFDGLKYLPTEIFWKILKKALYHDKLPYSCGEMKEMSFWEHWSAKDIEDHTNFVEPDVFIRFKEIDIIIEAKRLNERQQDMTQLRNEIMAYNNEFLTDDKALYFVQLGGLADKNDIEDYIDDRHQSGAIICKTDWTRLLDAMVTENKHLKTHNLSTSMAYSRILDDIIKGMELHQYYKKNWLADLKIDNYINECSLKNLFDYARCK